MIVVSKKHKQYSYRILILYITFLSVFGPYGEILIGNMYTAIFGMPLWHYHILPVHHAYTSLIAPLVWGAAGAIAYFLYIRFYAHSKLSLWILAMFVAAEMLAVEFAMNALYHAATSGYIFYYYPADLFHLASVQTLPFYYLVGVALFISMKRFQRDPIFFSILSVAFMLVLVYFAT